MCRRLLRQPMSKGHAGGSARKRKGGAEGMFYMTVRLRLRLAEQ